MENIKNNGETNFVLIVIDTLRANSMGCYGYALNTTPVIDRYASEGTRFAWAFTESPPTQPAFTAILTGTNPIINNVVSHILLKDCIIGWKEKAPPITPGVKMLAEFMKEKNYKTYAVDNLIMMRSHFDRGYDKYIYSSTIEEKERMDSAEDIEFLNQMKLVGEEWWSQYYGELYSIIHERRDRMIMVTADEINTRLIPLLHKVKNERFFIFAHYWDPHAPYVPPKEFQKFMVTRKNETKMLKEMIIQGKDLSWEDFVRTKSSVEDPTIRAKYDGEIAYVDDRLSQVLDEITDLKLDEKTLVIITSDHGESLGTHNTLGHAGLHDTVIRIPLIFHGPSIPEDKIVEGMARQVDIVPTILDFAGINFREHYPLSGISLKAVITGEAENTVDTVYCSECTQQKTRAIRTWKWKFIKSMEDAPRSDQLPSKELYDMENDPWETRNLIDEMPDLAAYLERRMRAWVRERCREVGRERDVVITTPRGTRRGEYRDVSQYTFKIRCARGDM